LNSEKLGKIWKKGKLKSEKLWKKSRLNSEMIWKIWPYLPYLFTFHLTVPPYFSYLNTAVGDVTLCVEVYHCSRGHNSICGGISYNSVCARIILQ
jgi:hypothetical protein